MTGSTRLALWALLLAIAAFSSPAQTCAPAWAPGLGTPGPAGTVSALGE